MAKIISTNTKSSHLEHQKVKRPGIHAKTRHSNLKSSKYYTKKYRGQGR